MTFDATTLPGIYRGVPFDAYLAAPFPGSGNIKKARSHSLLHARYEMDHPTEASTAQMIGTAVDCALTEPERFAEVVVPCPTKTRNSNAYRELRADQPDAIILTETEMEQVTGTVAAIRATPHIAKYFDAVPPEDLQCVIRFDVETEHGRTLRGKGRLDLPIFQAGTIIDLKTCLDASEWEFERAVNRFGYDFQAAYYMHGAWALGLDVDLYYCLAVEKAPPYGMRLHQIPDWLLRKRWLQLMPAMEAFAGAMENGEWPGYPEYPHVVQAPPWENGEDDDLPSAIGEGDVL